MGLDALIRTSVATAKRLTGSLLVPVQIKRRTEDGGGNTTGESSKTYRALVEDRIRRFQGDDGVERVSQAKVTFLEDVPVEHPDSVVLPGGREGPVLAVERLLDPKRTSGGGYVTEVWIGASTKGGVL